MFDGKALHNVDSLNTCGTTSNLNFWHTTDCAKNGTGPFSATFGAQQTVPKTAQDRFQPLLARNRLCQKRHRTVFSHFWRATDCAKNGTGPFSATFG